jgi:uncharacterized Zn finger protein (UPF0148 family)
VVPKITCPECGFNFHVGEVAKVICPMCSQEVVTGLAEVEEEPETIPDDSEE